MRLLNLRHVAGFGFAAPVILADVERHRVAGVDTSVDVRNVKKQIRAAGRGGDETESFVIEKTLDGAGVVH